MFKYLGLTIAFLLSSAFVFAGGNETITSFYKAKILLHSKVYKTSTQRKTFYCGCSYSKKKKNDLKSCNYKIRTPKTKKGKPNYRPYKTEWEHIVPANNFIKSFKEYKRGCGRSCVRKKNKFFARMEADIYNLVPSVGEVNGDRRNFTPAMIPGEKREYGKCEVEVLKLGKGRGKVEPPDDRLGDFARTYLYMDSVYPGRGIISKKNRKLFEAWDKLDPVSKEECQLTKLKEEIQKNENLVVKKKCKAKGLW